MYQFSQSPQFPPLSQPHLTVEPHDESPAIVDAPAPPVTAIDHVANVTDRDGAPASVAEPGLEHGTHRRSHGRHRLDS